MLPTHPFLISCCSIALRDRPVAEALGMIAEAGFPGVEIWYPHIEKLDADGLRGVAEQCARLRLTPTVISPYFAFTRGEEWHARSLKTARDVLAAAKVLQVKKIRTFIDIGPDGLASQDATAAHWQAARDGLHELCALDPASDFVIETHEQTLADSLPTVQRILEEVDRPNLHVNFQVNQEFLKLDYMQCLETLFPFVTHMHWDQIREDGTATYIEEPGLVDFPRMIGWLASRNYQGTASVEYCWHPIEEKRLGTAVQFLSNLIGKPGPLPRA
jgi:sugar phosphate isomerase/epimerase